MVAEKRPENDPDVIGLVRQLLEPPSAHLRKTTRLIVETAQSKAAMKILGHKVGVAFDLLFSLFYPKMYKQPPSIKVCCHNHNLLLNVNIHM